ncbi:GIY-YIG nuclease family protein, partial [Streptomyces sp. NPDC049577]|uniref:GIY-YIG nuclease family protein n=1 Tax=Streptomyces sp. NPDC049577 TaxID=3155153 RepID=UPI0034367658
MEGQVYVIGSPDSPIVKIGVSTDPERRLRQIQAMSPLRLRVLWTCAEGYPLERRLHFHLRTYHTHGEWFDFQGLDPVTVMQGAVGEVWDKGASRTTLAEAARIDLCAEDAVPGCVCGHENRLHGTGGCTVMGWDELQDCQCTAYTPASEFNDEALKAISEHQAPTDGSQGTSSLGHPLALSMETRVRLGRAVRELLNTPALVGAPDPVRLALLVLAARTPWGKDLVKITSRELGQWLGLSVSHMQSVVLPGLRRSGVVTTKVLTGEFGEDRNLECEIHPLRTARYVPGHPLDLSQKELDTWLRLVEALLAPCRSEGMPAGLLSGRTGRGASTDRLAMLLLVLDAAENGRVRLCGGTVDKHRGRPTATLARLLRCGLPGAERVLERLEGANLVQRPRQRTISGLYNRSRLVVPAVVAAHCNPRPKHRIEVPRGVAVTVEDGNGAVTA